MNNSSVETAECLKELRIYNIRTEIGIPAINAHLIAFFIMSILMAIPTIVLNGLVIITFFTTSTLQGPSYILLTSFAITDLMVGLLAEPLLMALTLSDVMHNEKLFCLLALPVRQVTTSLATVSFYSLVAISIDRYLAIRLKLRYKSTVTVTRVRIIVLGLWVLSLSVGFLSTVRVVKALVPAAAVILVATLVLLIVLYVKSFSALRKYCTQVKPEEESKSESSTVDASRKDFKRPCIDVNQYRRALTTMVLVFAMIIICYIPTVCVFGYISIVGVNRITTAAVNYATLTVNMKSLVNPILYVVRMREVKGACLVSLRKIRHWRTSYET